MSKLHFVISLWIGIRNDWRHTKTYFLSLLTGALITAVKNKGFIQ